MKATLDDGIVAYIRYHEGNSQPVDMEEFFARFDLETLEPSSDPPLCHLLRQKRNEHVENKTKRMREIEAEFGSPIEVLLGQWYSDAGESTVVIAQRVGISAATVGNWLRKSGIVLRDPWIANTQRRSHTKPSPATLRELYQRKETSGISIAGMYKVSPPTVYGWLHAAGVTVRDSGEAQRGRTCGAPLGEDELRTLYLDQHLSMADIGARCYASSSVVKKWLDMYGIPTRSPATSRLLRQGAYKPSNVELHTDFFSARMSTKAMGRKYRVSDTSVRNWMNAAGLNAEVRNAAKAMWRIGLSSDLEKVVMFNHPIGGRTEESPCSEKDLHKPEYKKQGGKSND